MYIFFILKMILTCELLDPVKLTQQLGSDIQRITRLDEVGVVCFLRPSNHNIRTCRTTFCNKVCLPNLKDTLWVEDRRKKRVQIV